MLQRAARNAYSWWWASHVRTKQSKWLEQSLQDMEEKVHSVVKLIEEDGDSFARRAEMYYRKRPELLQFVEESYRAYRALAERYDHLSTELQNANNTIANLCPDQIELMQEDDEYSLTTPTKFPQVPIASPSIIPKVPKAPIRDWKGLVTASKHMNIAKKKQAKPTEYIKEVSKSGLSKNEALEEIGKLHKDILVLQTAKEFVKSSYESGLSRYWDMENQISEKQGRICFLEDEHGNGKVIEDDEARKLMAGTAIKSCQETLDQLQEKQEKSNQEAKKEHKKIEVARQKLESIKKEFLHYQTDEEVESADAEESKWSTEETDHTIKEKQEMQMIKEKIKEHFEVGPLASLTVSELAEKIDELVNKVISLEISVSSQTFLIDRLRTEADDLHAQIQILEEDKANLVDDAQTLSCKLKKMEEKLHGIQDLDRDVEKENSTLQTHFDEARSTLDNLSEKLSSVKSDEEPEAVSSPTIEDQENEVVKDVEEQKSFALENDKEEASTSIREDVEDKKEDDDSGGASVDNQGENIKPAGTKTVTFQEPISKDLLAEEKPKSAGDTVVKTDSYAATRIEGEIDWQMMLLTGLEDKERIILSEYTTILRNYKELKKKLTDMEKKEKDRDFDIALQINDLKSAILKRDEDIQHLRQRLNQEGANGNTKEVHQESSSSHGTAGPQCMDIHFIKNEDEELNLMLVHQLHVMSEVEEKLRTDIDAILDENLEFWLKFSTSYHQIQKFETTVHDLQQEISKVNEKRQQEGSNTGDTRSELRPIYKHLKEIQAELTVWLEQSVSLKDEMERRSTSLSNIQEQITVALKQGVEEDVIRFSSHQAAKFQGEILNMKQENDKVNEELQAGADHVIALQEEIEKSLKNLNEEFDINGDHPQLRHSASRNRVPLRSFIFGTKAKKQKHSIFSCMHPNRKYQVLKAGIHF